MVRPIVSLIFIMFCMTATKQQWEEAIKFLLLLAAMMVTSFIIIIIIINTIENIHDIITLQYFILCVVALIISLSPSSLSYVSSILEFIFNLICDLKVNLLIYYCSILRNDSTANPYGTVYKPEKMKNCLMYNILLEDF